MVEMTSHVICYLYWQLGSEQGGNDRNPSVPV